MKNDNKKRNNMVDPPIKPGNKARIMKKGYLGPVHVRHLLNDLSRLQMGLNDEYNDIVDDGIPEFKRMGVCGNLLYRVHKIMNEPNESMDIINILNGIIESLIEVTGCDAVGIRHKKGEDFPFLIQSGFSNSFLLTENSLLYPDSGDACLMGLDGNVLLKCVCGMVISGRIDPTDPLFTPYGSFWTNDARKPCKQSSVGTRQFLAGIRCALDGYISMAVIRIRGKDEVIGLLQLNSRIPGQFDIEMIHTLEIIGTYIGSLLLQMKNEEGSDKALDSRASELTIENKGLNVKLAEQNLVEEKLRQHEGFFNQSEYVSNMGHYVMDVLKGDFLCSKNLSRLFGIEKQDINDIQSFLKIVHPDHQKEIGDKLKSIMSEEQIAEINFDYEFRAANSLDQDSRWIHSIGTIERDKWGHAVKLFGTMQDITARKLNEMEKDKNELRYQQIQKSESLSRMAGAIAHKFNNLLGVLMGNIELAKYGLPGESGADGYLDEALIAADKVADVTRLMLTYIGQVVGIDHIPLDLSQICHRNMMNMKASMPDGVRLMVDIPTSGPYILGNENQVRQVMSNLVINAWESLGEEAGTIQIAVRTETPENIAIKNRFPVDWKPKKDRYACLEVIDEGCGIAESDIGKLFDPFFSNKFIGSGLGLSVVLGILRAHQGAVTVSSEVGVGSTFQVFFPLSHEYESEKHVKSGVNSFDIAGCTVLLVEDEEAVRKMTSRVLIHMGFSVIEAKDGIEGLEIFQRFKEEIDCVLCDLTMPQMDGWEMLTALRKIEPGIPVILTSGYDQTQVMSGDHSEWPQIFLRKPYLSGKLREAIQNAVIFKH